MNAPRDKRIRRLRIDGGHLEYAWHGPSPGEAPTLVFLHEGLGCVGLWRDFPAKLAAATGCGAMVYSRFGYGRSDPCRLPRPTHFMHEEGLRLLPAVLSAAEIREALVIGHSDGGSIALIYAGGTAARRLRALITEAAHVFCEEITLQSIRRAREAYRAGHLKRKLQKYHGANTECAFWGWNGAWLNPEFVDWNLESFLPGIKVPLLAIQGEEDPYGTPAQLEAIARGAGAGAQTLLVPGCGHSPHQECEDIALKAMTDFVLQVLDQTPRGHIPG
jgi:pimeloyl-ACP methyl ester carboxylesterase